MTVGASTRRSLRRVLWLATFAVVLVVAAVEVGYHRLARPIKTSGRQLSPMHEAIVWGAYQESDAPRMHGIQVWDLGLYAFSRAIGSQVDVAPAGARVAMASASATLAAQRRKASFWTRLATATWMSRNLSIHEVLGVLAESRRVLDSRGYEGASVLLYAKELKSLSAPEIALLACVDVRGPSCVPCDGEEPSLLRDVIEGAVQRRAIDGELAGHILDQLPVTKLGASRCLGRTPHP